MIYGVMVTYNDWPFVQTAVESLADKVDMIIAIDGRYVDFPQIGGSDISTDGTLEYLCRHNKVHLITVPNMDEVRKRNCYLVGRIGDWYVHLDADEEWVGGRIVLPADADMVQTWLLPQGMESKKKMPCVRRVRVFRHLDGLHYEGKHYWLKDKDGRTFALLDKPGSGYKMKTTNDLSIVHRDGCRSDERKRLKRQYYRELVKRESRIREVV